MRAALLVLALLVAGCAVPGGSEDVPAPGPRAAPTVLDDCAILEAPTVVRASAAGPFVPAGFVAAIDEDGQTGVVLGAATCAQGSRGFFAIEVVPQDPRLRAEGVRHFFEPEHVAVAGEPFADALAVLGIGGSNASVVASAAAPSPGFTIEGEGWAHRGAGTGAAVVPPGSLLGGGRFREWFPAPGGYGYLEASFALEGAAFGLAPMDVTTGEGTPAREVVGAFSAQAIVLDRSGYADATLGFVPYP